MIRWLPIVAIVVAASSLARGGDTPRDAELDSLMEKINARRAAIHTVELRVDFETRSPKLDAQHAEIPADALIDGLNRQVRLDRTAVYDVGRQRLRLEDKDTRDIAALANEYQLDFQQKLTLDQTRIQIFTRSLHVMMFEAATPKPLAAVSEGSAATLQQLFTTLGLLPAFVLEGEPEVKVSAKDDVIVLTSRYPDGTRYEAEIDAVSYAVRSFRRFIDDKLLDAVTNDDFRTVNGVALPFRSTMELRYIERVDTCVVRAARVNEPIDGAVLFRVPDGYYIQESPSSRLQLQDLPNLLLGDTVIETAEEAGAAESASAEK